MSRRGLKKFLKDNNLTVFRTDDYVEEFRKVFGNKFELVYNYADWLKIHITHRDGKKYLIQYSKEIVDSSHQPYKLYLAGCSLGWTGDTNPADKDGATEPVFFINNTLSFFSQDNNKEKIKLLAWLTQYLRSSHRRVKSKVYDADTGVQPSYPDCLVLDYELFQSKTKTFGHRTNQLRLKLNGNRAICISLYKFKRYAKREYECKLTLFSTRLIEKEIRNILEPQKDPGMKYIKKPVVIEAIEVKADNFDEICGFIGYTPQTVDDLVHRDGCYARPYSAVIIKTLEGDMMANIGDMIIKGVKGEFYPCKPDIFAETYDKVEDILQ